MKEKWKDLDLKTRIAYITALIAFTIGWALTIAGFIIGAGVISDSVLWVLGQSLVYAASVFGVGLYITGSVRNMKREIGRFMHRQEIHNKSSDDLYVENTNEPEELDAYDE